MVKVNIITGTLIVTGTKFPILFRRIRLSYITFFVKSFSKIK